VVKTHQQNKHRINTSFTRREEGGGRREKEEGGGRRG
jgi:hypothetical protein